MSRLIPLMCVAVAVGASSAHAQKPRVVVVPFVPGEGASETASSKFQALLVDELKSRGDALELVAPPATKPAPPPEKPGVVKRGPSPEAVAALEAGKKAFDDLRFEDAVANLRKGIDGMLADPATADYEGVTDAYVKLAAAEFRMGEEKDAKTALLDFARFAPNYELSAGFPPVFQREFDKAKKRLDKQPKGTISIEGPIGLHGVPRRPRPGHGAGARRDRPRRYALREGRGHQGREVRPDRQRHRRPGEGEGELRRSPIVDRSPPPSR